MGVSFRLVSVTQLRVRLGRTDLSLIRSVNESIPLSPPTESRSTVSITTLNPSLHPSLTGIPFRARSFSSRSCVSRSISRAFSPFVRDRQARMSVRVGGGVVGTCFVDAAAAADLDAAGEAAEGMRCRNVEGVADDWGVETGMEWPGGRDRARMTWLQIPRPKPLETGRSARGETTVREMGDTYWHRSRSPPCGCPPLGHRCVSTVWTPLLRRRAQDLLARCCDFARVNVQEVIDETMRRQTLRRPGQNRREADQRDQIPCAIT